mgnify:CR=1 FL=1
MYLIKLGGSVITEKSSTATFRSEIMDELSSQIAKAGKECILVHGAGSFGHVLAKKYELNNGFSSEKQRYGFSLTQAMVQTLNSHVLSSLHHHKLPAVSLPAHSLLTLSNHQMEHIATDFFKTYLKKGFLPVTYGDVALDSTLGFSICSGDLLMWSLAKTFQPEKIIFVMDEDGVYDKNPKKNADAKLMEIIQRDEIDLLQTSLDEHADVTAGMMGKLQTIKKITALHIDTILVNGLVPNRLYQVLTDQSTVHTIIKG